MKNAVARKKSKKDAVVRAQEMMHIPIRELPYGAVAYRNFLSNKYGGCGEVCLTAFAGYAQKVEGLPCKQDLYVVSEKDWNEFETNGWRIEFPGVLFSSPRTSELGTSGRRRA